MLSGKRCDPETGGRGFGSVGEIGRNGMEAERRGSTPPFVARHDDSGDLIVKFMLLCYDDEKAWERAGPEALKAAMQEAVGLTHRLDAKGRYIAAAPLLPASMGASVRVRNGKPSVTDGPFTETHEVIGGFYLIDVADQAEAIRVAQEHPGARLGTVEVREVMELEGLPKSRM